MPARKIPTKKELLHLQKLYRTDKRIGQALGNVPEHLVAYWRRKKGIGRASFSKYSLSEIKDLWERYGDDYKAGQQLGITKQAFYRWRKKYKLLDRPTILKLEQLELKFYDEHRLSRRGEKEPPAANVLQKIVSYHNSQSFVPLNQTVLIPASLAVTIDDFGVLARCSTGLRRRLSRRQLSPERFDSILDMIESGYFIPGQVIWSDRLEAAAISVTASFASIAPGMAAKAGPSPPDVEIELNPSIKLFVSGSAALRQTPFDLACQIAESLENVRGERFVLELSGSAIERLTLADRVALTSYVALLVTSSVFIEPDQTYLTQLQRLGEQPAPVPFSDKNCHNLDSRELLLRRNKPHFYSLSGGEFVASYASLNRSQLRRIRVGPLVGGTLENIKAMAMALKGVKLRSGLEVYVLPMTRKIFIDATRRRYTQLLLDAGARIGNICTNPPQTKLGRSEYELTTEITSPASRSFLTSIATIAQAARAGKITKRIFDSA